jgi:hypothetical protein
MTARVWAKFAWGRELFIVVLDPTHRGYSVLHFLSLNQTQMRLRLEDIINGAILGFVRHGNELPAGLGVTLSC